MTSIATSRVPRERASADTIAQSRGARPPAIDALKTNTSFKPVGIALRDQRPSTETLGRAAERLTDLVGDTVIPLEQEISKAAAKHLPRFQHDYGPLSEKLKGVGLAGSDRAGTLNQDIVDVLLTDASDAPQRLGAETSALYDKLDLILQAAMGWSNSHLHEYEIADRRYGIPDPDWPTSEPIHDERRVQLKSFIEARVRRLEMEFGVADNRVR